MAKVLKVTKPDKTVHVVPIANKDFYLHLNNRIFAGGPQMKLEEIDEKEAENLPFFDEKYVTGTEAQSRVSELEKEIERLKQAAEKQQSMATEIDHLQRQLASKPPAGEFGNNGSIADPASASRPYVAETPLTGEPGSTDGFNKKLKEIAAAEAAAGQQSTAASTLTEKPAKTAEEVIASIREAKTADEVNSLAKDDMRKTVQDAAAKKITELSAPK